MELGFSEILVVMLVIVVLFGPDKIPQIARDLGSGVRKMKGAVEDIKTEILKETDNPVSEIKREIEKVKEAAQEYDLSQTIKNSEAEVKIQKEAQEEQLKDSHTGPVSR
ncbi:MAG: preprotein translocase [Chryseobacterium sp. SCN 40-13]|nr:MAG: preprotein translocase [Chryseobacterium sp. SCN 40-13]